MLTHTRRKIWFLLPAILIAVSLLALPQGKAVHPNILLITIDTLRSDRVGCYGYTAGQTPNLDRIAAEGIRFADAVSHVPLTRPSHTSIFTGLFPVVHGVHDNVSAPLDKKFRTLAEILKSNGYQTAGFVAAFVVNSQSGLDRGFDRYDDEFNPQKQPTQFALNLEKRGDEIYQEFSGWMAKRNSKLPYFAWVHLYDPHFPYMPPPPYAQRFADHPYDGEVAFADDIVGRILKLVGPNTLLIVASDHGESLGDHGENAHSFFIYDSTLRVPLIFRWPGVFAPGKIISPQVRLVDLLPTILDYLSISPPAILSGTSLRSLVETGKGNADNLSYCETYTPLLHFGWSSLLGVRSAGWKYIDAPRAELYDLSKDPSEKNNLVKEDSTKAAEYKKWLAQNGAFDTTNSASNPELDPEQLEKLASLGYAGVAAQLQTPRDKLPDPKDKIEDFKVFNRLIREGIEAYQQEHYQQAAQKFQELENRKIPSFEVHYYLGRSLFKSGSYVKAATELETALAILPHFLPAYRDLSEAYEARKENAKAEDTLKRGLSEAPGTPALVQSLAWLYQKQGQQSQAEALLVANVKEHPDAIESRFRLAAIYRDNHQPEKAIEQLKQIVRLDAADAEAHNQLGMLYGGNNRLAEAIAEFKEAARLSPKDPDIRHNLQLAISRQSSGSKGAGANQQPLAFRVIETPSRAAADLLLRKLQSGESWETLATNYSIHSTGRQPDPVLRMAPGEINSAFLTALSKLKPGQVSPVIEESGKFYLLRLEPQS